MGICIRRYASDAWGPSFSMVNVADPSVRAALMQARPTRAGKEDETSHEWITSQGMIISTSTVSVCSAAVSSQVRLLLLLHRESAKHVSRPREYCAAAPRFTQRLCIGTRVGAFDCLRHFCPKLQRIWCVRRVACTDYRRQQRACVRE